MTLNIDQVWAVLDELSDPEIPVLSLRDLGILRDVRTDEHGTLEIVITPTYSGCPATELIADDVRARARASSSLPINTSVTMAAPASKYTCWCRPRGRLPRPC